MKQLFSCLLIIDDFAEDRAFMRYAKILHGLYTKSRQFGFSVITSSQKLNALAPIVSLNSSSGFIFSWKIKQNWIHSRTISAKCPSNVHVPKTCPYQFWGALLRFTPAAGVLHGLLTWPSSTKSARWRLEIWCNMEEYWRILKICFLLESLEIQKVKVSKVFQSCLVRGPSQMMRAFPARDLQTISTTEIQWGAFQCLPQEEITLNLLVAWYFECSRLSQRAEFYPGPMLKCSNMVQPSSNGSRNIRRWSMVIISGSH